MAPRPALALLAAAALCGCASLNRVDSNVMSYGNWPAGRAPDFYCFERLPSQQAQPEQQAQLELAARGALEKAGFTAAAANGPCSVNVQLGSRITRYDTYSPWADPFGGHGPDWRYPGWHGAGWYGGGWPYSYPYYYAVYDREVALLIRDKATGAPLYEARARSDSAGYSGSTAVLAAMFEAALKDFPTPAINPRRVTVELPGKES